MTPTEPITALILGLGGNVSQGILKSLRMSRLEARVIGACVTSTAAGLYGVDRAYVSPYAADPGFVDWLVEVCRKERVDVVLSGVEAVLEVLAEQLGTLEDEATTCIVSPTAVLRVAADKLSTTHWLEAHGFNRARAADTTDDAALERLLEDCGYPLVAKPRVGSGSRGVFQVVRDSDLARARALEGYMLQEAVGTEASEYTAGCFSDREGRVRGCLVMRRSLTAGTSTSIEAGDFPDVRTEAQRIVAELRPTGPCNIQLRVGPDGPVCFEINARYSGTAPIRAHFGFNDVEAGIRHFVLNEAAVDLPEITRGYAARYWNEVYIEPNAIETLERSGVLEAPATQAQFSADLTRPHQ